MTDHSPRVAAAVRRLRDVSVEMDVAKRRAMEAAAVAEDAEIRAQRAAVVLADAEMMWRARWNEARLARERAENAIARVEALHVLDPREIGDCVICREPYPVRDPPRRRPRGVNGRSDHVKSSGPGFVTSSRLLWSPDT